MDETTTRYASNGTLSYPTTSPKSDVALWSTVDNISTQISTAVSDTLSEISFKVLNTTITPIDPIQTLSATGITESTPLSVSSAEPIFHNGSGSHPTTFTRFFCPAIYDFERCTALNDTTDPLYMCEKSALAFFFGLFVVSIGIVAIFGNAIMPIVVWRRKSMRTKQNYIKVSLSFNDMITGFIMLFSVLPNMIWFRNSTKKELLDGMQSMYNSPAAVIAVSALNITLQGSLFHLMYLSADRYFAIKWPIKNRHRKRSTVVWVSVGIWALILIGSAITIALPQYYSFLYNPLVFTFTLGYELHLPSLLHGYLHYSIALFVPYVATIVLTVLTGIWAFRKLNSSSRKLQSIRMKRRGSATDNGIAIGQDSLILRDESYRGSDKMRRPQWALVKTIMIMSAAFIVAWSVFFMLFFLSVREEAFGAVYLVSFCAAWSNSVANVIIYSLKDTSFRVAVRSTFLSKRRLRKWNGAIAVRKAADFQMRASFERRGSNTGSSN